MNEEQNNTGLHKRPDRITLCMTQCVSLWHTYSLGDNNLHVLTVQQIPQSGLSPFLSLVVSLCWIFMLSFSSRTHLSRLFSKKDDFHWQLHDFALVILSQPSQLSLHTSITRLHTYVICCTHLSFSFSTHLSLLAHICPKLHTSVLHTYVLAQMWHCCPIVGCALKPRE